jgi:hypothetical protein
MSSNTLKDQTELLVNERKMPTMPMSPTINTVLLLYHTAAEKSLHQAL